MVGDGGKSSSEEDGLGAGGLCLGAGLNGRMPRHFESEDIT